MEPKKKSTFDVWQRWAKALRASLRRIAAVYAQHEDSKGAEKISTFLERLELFIDPASHAQELATKGYEVKGSFEKLNLLALKNLRGIFKNALTMLPEFSADMQRLLQSTCYGDCNGRVASDIFKGPHRSEYEGIGSGAADQAGTLPWMLGKLLDDAEVGGEDYLKQGLSKEDDAIIESSRDDEPQLERHALNQPKKRITATGVQ